MLFICSWVNEKVFCIFLHRVGSGSWVTDGIRTTNSTMVGNVTSVQCLSTHLTSFAVLVDVAGGLQVCIGCHSIVTTALYIGGLYLACRIYQTNTALLCDNAFLFWQEISKAERKALQVVSYIGCAISTICLIISIVFFILQG